MTQEEDGSTDGFSEVTFQQHVTDGKLSFSLLNVQLL